MMYKGEKRQHTRGPRCILAVHIWGSHVIPGFLGVAEWIFEGDAKGKQPKVPQDSTTPTPRSGCCLAVCLGPPAIGALSFDPFVGWEIRFPY